MTFTVNKWHMPIYYFEAALVFLFTSFSLFEIHINLDRNISFNVTKIQANFHSLFELSMSWQKNLSKNLKENSNQIMKKIILSNGKWSAIYI